MAGPGWLVLLLSLLFSSVVSILGAKVTSIIDDGYGNDQPGAKLAYSPGKNGHWNDNTACNPGSRFCVVLDISQTQNQTWTSTATFGTNLARQITLEFVGDGISVFFNLVRKGEEKYSTKCTFFLDGRTESTYSHEPEEDSETPEFLYKQNVFSKLDLVHGAHRLEIVVPNSNAEPNYLNFDYAEYSFDDSLAQTSLTSTTSSSASEASPRPTGISQPFAFDKPNATEKTSSKGVLQAAIIGGTISGTILLIAVIVFLLYRARHRGRGHEQPTQSDRLTFGVPSTYAGSTKKLSLPFWPHKPAYGSDSASNFRDIVTPYPEKRNSAGSYDSSHYMEKHAEYDDRQLGTPSKQGRTTRDRSSFASHNGPLLSPANALMQSFFPSRRSKRESHATTTTGQLSRLEDSMSPASSFPRHLSTFSDVRRAQQSVDTLGSSLNVLPLHSPPGSGAIHQSQNHTPKTHYSAV